MKILTPNNYKEKNENATLKDYVSYLETKQREIETSLSFAKSMLLSESAIENIKNQMKIILRMIENVEQYMGNIVLHSIDDLSLEELKSYFKDDYKHLLEQIEEVKQKINQIEEKHFAKGFFLFSILMIIVGAIITAMNFVGIVLICIGILFFFIAIAMSRSNYIIALTIIAHGASHNIPINFLTPRESEELQQIIFQTKENIII